MAYLPSSKPPRPSYSATPGWGGGPRSRGTLSKPTPLAKPSLKVNEPGFKRFNP